jgi:hypothetical protein
MDWTSFLGGLIAGFFMFVGSWTLAELVMSRLKGKKQIIITVDSTDNIKPGDVINRGQHVSRVMSVNYKTNEVVLKQIGRRVK